MMTPAEREVMQDALADLLEAMEEALVKLDGLGSSFRDDADRDRVVLAHLEGDRGGWMGGPFLVDKVRALAQSDAVLGVEGAP